MANSWVNLAYSGMNRGFKSHYFTPDSTKHATKFPKLTPSKLSASIPLSIPSLPGLSQSIGSEKLTVTERLVSLTQEKVKLT